MSDLPRCRKCGNECNEFWKLCPQCYAKEISHEKEVAKRMTQHFGAFYGDSYEEGRDMTGSYFSKEHKHRRLRSAEDHFSDEKPEDRNSRTQYHGHNYKDE